MPKKRDTFLNNRWKRVLILISAFLSMYLISFIMDPFTLYWANYFKRDWSDILGDWSVSLIFCFVISEMSIVISTKLNKRISWTENAGKRFAMEAVLNLTVILVFHLLLTLLCIYLRSDEQLSLFGANESIEETRGMIQWLLGSSIIAFVIIGINTVNYLILNWKDAALKAAELNELAMEAELQALKLQIDPHFVFNNLSVLSELILEDQQLGYDYAENFSRIYRYLLVNSKKDVIALDDELKFLQSYMFLIAHRFGEGVQFDIDVDQTTRQRFLPPLTLQLLVENALKHNRTNKKDALKVRIYTRLPDELVVENVLLPIEKPLDSSGLGIKNIKRRYHLLSAKEPQIERTQHHFKVVLPLIKTE